MPAKRLESTQTESSPFIEPLPFGVKLKGTLPSDGVQLQVRLVDDTEWATQYTFTGNDKLSPPIAGSPDLEWKIVLPTGMSGIEGWSVLAVEQSKPR